MVGAIAGDGREKEGGSGSAEGEGDGTGEPDGGVEMGRLEEGYWARGVCLKRDWVG